MLVTHRNHLKSLAPNTEQGCKVARCYSGLVEDSIGFNSAYVPNASASCAASVTDRR